MSHQIFFCPTRLKIIGLLWCDGGAYEKAYELYYMISSHRTGQIASNNKLFKHVLNLMFRFSTEMVYKLEPKYNSTIIRIQKEQKILDKMRQAIVEQI